MAACNGATNNTHYMEIDSCLLKTTTKILSIVEKMEALIA
jgi:hypothetical protein